MNNHVRTNSGSPAATDCRAYACYMDNIVSLVITLGNSLEAEAVSNAINEQLALGKVMVFADPPK
jgi:hypothetical protein